MTKRILMVSILSLILLGGLFALKFWQIGNFISQMQPPPPPVVAVADVKNERWSSALTAVGSFRAVSGIDISNEVAGQIQAIHFQSGQTVKSGQLLVELDSASDRAELESLLAEQRLAQIRFQRSAQLVDKKFVSQADYDQNKALLDQASSAVAAKKTLIAKKQIRAPFAGELGIRQVDLGQYLSVGSAIVPLQKRDPILLDFTLPERNLGQISVGQRVEATVQAYPEQVFTGEISALNPQIDRQSRSLTVQARFMNPHRQLHPGMFAQVRVVSAQTQSVLTVPDTAVTYNPYGSSVFLLISDGNSHTVQNRQVQTGQSHEGRVEIIEGLQAGDRVVSAGQLKLRNGVQVVIDNQAAPGERVSKP